MYSGVELDVDNSSEVLSCAFEPFLQGGPPERVTNHQLVLIDADEPISSNVATVQDHPHYQAVFLSHLLRLYSPASGGLTTFTAIHELSRYR